MLSKVKTIFFDFDGTLHDSIKVYAPAFLKAYDYLVENHYAEPRSWNPDEISYWLGFNSIDMWKAFMPGLDPAVTTKASKMIGTEMAKQIQDGNAVLYDGALYTLSYLKNKGYTLVFLSNCGEIYRDLVKEQFSLDRYFHHLICSGQFEQIPKYDIVRQIKSNYPDDKVIVGDRFHDMEAGFLNGIYTIGCKYGYGKTEELIKADYAINYISELKNLL